jgi:hypothetical protein
VFGPARAVLVAGAVVLVGCRSDDPSPSGADDAGTVVATTEAVTDDATTTDRGSTITPSPDVPATSGEPDVGDTTASPSAPPPTTPMPSAPLMPVTLPEDADELSLLDSSDGGDAWGGDGGWEVEVPGEASATVIGGVGVMETDARGTHEWVRAIAEDSLHDDATVFARIAPVRSDEGTVFLGLRGDGEWRDAFRYVPQSGVVLEYGYAPVFEGEIAIIVLDGADQLRIGPVIGPVLSDGQSADIRFEVVGDRARAKVWRSGEDEPPDWTIETEAVSTDGGVVQISYRDGVAQSVAWEELTLTVWP